MEIPTDNLFILTCKRCDHKWQPKRKDKTPLSCPACKSYQWNKPKEDDANTTTGNA